MRSKRKYLWTLILIPFILIVFWFFFPFDKNNLPPKTPLKISRHITGLNIPDDVNFDFFNRSENDFNGNYVDEIVIGLSVEQSATLQNEWQEKGYGNEPVPKIDPVYDTGKPDFFSKNISSSDTCWHRHTHSDKYDSVSVFDISSNKLIIYDISS